MAKRQKAFNKLKSSEIVTRKKIKNKYQNFILVDLKKAVKGLRPLRTDLNDIDLRKNLSNNQKRKIKKIILEYAVLTKRPGTELVSPGKNLKELETLAQHKKGNWKKLFIPKGDVKAVIKKHKNKITVESSFFTARIIKWNPRLLVKNPDAEIKRVLKNVKFDRLILLAGKHEIVAPAFETINALIKEVKKMMGEYERTFKRWMFGVKVFNFKKQAKMSQYVKVKNKLRKKKKKLDRK